MNILTIAARVSSAGAKCSCGCDKVYDDGRDAYFCPHCGIADGNVPAVVTAGRKRRRKRPEKVAKPSKPPAEVELAPELDVLAPKTEFSVRAEISLSVDFEGDVTKQQLLKKLRNEVMAAIKQAVTITANELQAAPSTVMVKPISFEVAVNDQADLQDEMEG